MATDITDPVVFATIIQTAVLSLTLIIFIMSFRTQNKANREAAYQKVLDDYTDSMKMLVENPSLARMQSDVARMLNPASDQTPRTNDEVVTRNFIMLLYSLFERTHLLYRKKWIDDDTWSQWDKFMQVISRHPMFIEIHQTGEGMWDKPFMDYVSTVLKKNESSGKRTNS